jgi:hypothetical protein
VQADDDRGVTHQITGLIERLRLRDIDSAAIVILHEIDVATCQSSWMTVFYEAHCTSIDISKSPAGGPEPSRVALTVVRQYFVILPRRPKTTGDFFREVGH